MRKMLHKILILIIFPPLLTGLAGCYPDESSMLENADIVLTYYDSAYHFGGITTYIMPDTVIAVTDPDQPESNGTYNHSYDSAILAEMATQLNALGYERLSDTLTQLPDVEISLRVIATVSHGLAYSWYSTYDFKTGTLVALMEDLKPVPPLPADSLRVVWLGAVNGVAEGSDIEARIIKGIGQMFIQSPYL
jgi:hypothetical protein